MDLLQGVVVSVVGEGDVGRGVDNKQQWREEGETKECTDMAAHNQMRERLEFYHQNQPPNPQLHPPHCPGSGGGDRRGGGEGGSEHSSSSAIYLLLCSAPGTRSCGGQHRLTADLSAPNKRRKGASSGLLWPPMTQVRRFFWQSVGTSAGKDLCPRLESPYRNVELLIFWSHSGSHIIFFHSRPPVELACIIYHTPKLPQKHKTNQKLQLQKSSMLSPLFAASKNRFFCNRELDTFGQR